MKSASGALAWLRGIKRGYKFAILLLAAWAPFLFPQDPLLTCVLMGTSTLIFFLATGPTVSREGSRSPSVSVELEKDHAGP
jgi:hypothetical protein